MVAPVADHMRKRVRKLRADQTEPEAVLWDALHAKRLMGLKFRRQVPIDNYIVDFFCPEHHLIVELDGSQHQTDAAQAYDARRTAFLRSQGYAVLRFPNDDVLHDLDGVCSHIAATCEALR